jgi:hypothetical protein
MADYPAAGTRSAVGAVVTKRTGTASADRVPAGVSVLFVNGGAGAHVVTFTNTGTVNGLAVANRVTPSIPAGSGYWQYIDPALDGDGDGWVAIGIDGTATEISYYVIGV